MKKIFTILGIVALGISANAQTEVLSESFTFTGALNANGWVTHSGSTPGQLQASSGTANLVAGQTEDVNKAFTSAYTIEANKINKIEYSISINVASSTGLTMSGDYFMHFLNPAGATPSSTTFVGRLYIKGSATGYTLGVMNNGAGTPTPTPTYGTEVSYGTSSNVTVTYFVDNTLTTPTNYVTLKVGSQALISNSAGTGTAPTALSGIAIREGGNATFGTGNISIDNIIVNTYSPYLAVGDVTKSKINLVKSTVVKDVLTFGAKANVKVVNFNGQVLKSVSVEDGTTIDVSSLAKGVYLIKGDVNGETVVQKIIKQ